MKNIFVDYIGETVFYCVDYMVPEGGGFQKFIAFIIYINSINILTHILHILLSIINHN